MLLTGLIPTVEDRSITNICTLPAKYRPQYGIHFEAMAGGANPERNYLVKIGIDGIVSIYNYTGVSVQYGYGTTSYCN